jgi:hypothetical protein
LEDRCLFGEGGESEEESGKETAVVSHLSDNGTVAKMGHPALCNCGEIERESPEGKGGGEDVRVGEGRLREPDRIDRCEQRYGEGCRWAEKFLGEAQDREQTSSGEGTDDEARRQNVKPGEVPKRTEDYVGQRWVRVGEVWNEPAVAVEVQRGRNVVAALVPEVGQAQKGKMADHDSGVEDSEEKPVGEGREASCEAIEQEGRTPRAEALAMVSLPRRATSDGRKT